MKIATHWMKYDEEEREENCEFCNRKASYWTQLEDGEKGLSRCIFHCQAHREGARAKAPKEKDNYNAYRLGQLIKLILLKKI